MRNNRQCCLRRDNPYWDRVTRQHNFSNATAVLPHLVIQKGTAQNTHNLRCHPPSAPSLMFPVSRPYFENPALSDRQSAPSKTAFHCDTGWHGRRTESNHPRRTARSKHGLGQKRAFALTGLHCPGNRGSPTLLKKQSLRNWISQTETRHHIRRHSLVHAATTHLKFN